MNRFRYALDPLCLGAMTAYVVIHALVRPYTPAPFWHWHAADLLLVPAALPCILGLQRRLGLRPSDGYPSWSEIGLNTAVLSLAAEGVAPHLFAAATGDWRDGVAYAAGAAVAGIWWSFAARHGFDRLAQHYGWMEQVLAGPRLQRCRTTWLDALGDCRHILIAGPGHGPILGELLGRHPHVRITCVDASAGMLAAAAERARRSGFALARVTFIHATLPDWRPPEANYDAIVTNFFLDCFSPEELGEVVRTLASAAAPEARWVVADFTLPPRGLVRLRARAVHALMYAFFRIVTGLRARRVTAPDPFLAAQGFALAGRRTSEWGLLHADLWQRGRDEADPGLPAAYQPLDSFSLTPVPASPAAGR